ncbi:MAG TPA: hypothetical protein VJG32_19285 [Anaerolineae bacterium]|nr:hypothetical protein [Anaerolineae bacterium]
MRRLLLVALVIMLMAYREAAQRASVSIPLSGKQKGIAYAAWQPGEYSFAESDQALERYAALGGGWISLIVTGYQDNIDATSIVKSAATPTDADLIHVIDQARRLGLKVMLKPHVDLANDPLRWRGEIGFHFIFEQQWADWFSSYRRFIEHYAQLAEAHSVEQFSIGTELASTSHRGADWRGVIAGVRARYTGRITYAAMHSGEETRIRWWDAVDLIGVDAYYPLTYKPRPSLSALRASWTAYVSRLARLAAAWGKPILITEIGYRSREGAARQPDDWATAGPIDLQAQANAYQAAFESLYHQPWFAGMYWWMWFPNSRGGLADDSYTPFGKPAEDILRVWYSQPGNEVVTAQ